jgi:hypothetical protein
VKSFQAVKKTEAGLSQPGKRALMWTAFLAAISVFGLAAGAERPGAVQPSTPVFYRNVLPILQDRCQSCHRLGGIAPRSFLTYAETKPWAAAIAEQVQSGKMPPWFADPHYGHFANDPSLTPQQIDTIRAWAAGGTPGGDPHDRPPLRSWAGGWNIPKPEVNVQGERVKCFIRQPPFNPLGVRQEHMIRTKIGGL